MLENHQKRHRKSAEGLGGSNNPPKRSEKPRNRTRSIRSGGLFSLIKNQLDDPEEVLSNRRTEERVAVNRLRSIKPHFLLGFSSERNLPNLSNMEPRAAKITQNASSRLISVSKDQLEGLKGSRKTQNTLNSFNGQNDQNPKKSPKKEIFSSLNLLDIAMEDSDCDIADEMLFEKPKKNSEVDQKIGSFGSSGDSNGAYLRTVAPKAGDYRSLVIRYLPEELLSESSSPAGSNRPLFNSRGIRTQKSDESHTHNTNNTNNTNQSSETLQNPKKHQISQKKPKNPRDHSEQKNHPTEQNNAKNTTDTPKALVAGHQEHPDLRKKSKMSIKVDYLSPEPDQQQDQKSILKKKSLGASSRKSSIHLSETPSNRSKGCRSSKHPGHVKFNERTMIHLFHSNRRVRVNKKSRTKNLRVGML